MKITMIPQEVYEEIYKEHKMFLKNLNQKNKKLIVVFSGISGSGKTYIAKIIEEKLKAVRINNDSIRDIIQKKILPTTDLTPQEAQEIMLGYVEYLVNRLPQTNGLLILDSSIDRKYDLVSRIAKEKGYPLFVVALNIPRKEVEKRIVERNGDDAAPFLKNLDRQCDDNRVFREKNPVDFEFDKETETEIVTLLSLIRKKLDLQ